jgi:cell wall-associated NlpC family hydrolase
MIRLLNLYSRSLALLPLIFALAACSTSVHRPAPKPVKPPQNLQTEKAPEIKPDDLLYVLLRNEYSYWAGSPYQLGGNSLDGVDCSSLVQQVFQNSFNIDLPRTTDSQVKEGDYVNKSSLKVGDLVFFKTGRRTRHVGIYMGGDKFFHASTSKGTKISSLNNVYWKSRYWQSRRVI